MIKIATCTVGYQVPIAFRSTFLPKAHLVMAPVRILRCRNCAITWSSRHLMIPLTKTLRQDSSGGIAEVADFGRLCLQPPLGDPSTVMQALPVIRLTPQGHASVLQPLASPHSVDAEVSGVHGVLNPRL